MALPRVLSNSVWVTLRYAVVSAAGFVTSLAFAHFATKEVFGQYQLVLSTMALFSILSLPGLNMAAIKAITQKKPEAVMEAVWHSWRWSLVAVPFLMGYGIYQLAADQTIFGTALLIAGVLFPFFYAPNTWYVFYEGQSKFRPVAIRTIISSVVVTAGLFIALRSRLNVAWLVAIFLAISAAFTAYYCYEVWRRLGFRSTNLARQTLDFGYGLRVSLQKGIYSASEALPPLVIGVLLGHASVAVFQIANLFLGAVAGFIGALAAITLPAIFSRSANNDQTVMRQTLLIGAITSLGYYLLVRLLFSFFYGPEYHLSYQIALLLTGLPFVIALRTFLVNYFTAAERNGIIVAVYMVANLIALGVFTALTHRTNFSVAASSYLYILNMGVVLPLLTMYLARLPRARRSSNI